MFEFPEQGIKVSKQDYAEQLPGLRVDLINAQYDLHNADFSVVVLIAGDDRIGIDELVQLMHEWMDGRFLQTQIFQHPTREELERPRFWRYWRMLPPKGRIGVFAGAWAMTAIADRLRGRIDGDGFAKRLAHIRQFEQDLANDGTVILKYWVHIPKKELKKRLKKAQKDPDATWQLEETDWEIYDIYDDAMPHIESLLGTTHTDSCPWHVLDGSDDRYRNLNFANILRNTLQQRLAHVPQEPIVEPLVTEFPDALGAVDFDLRQQSGLVALRQYEIAARHEA